MDNGTRVKASISLDEIATGCSYRLAVLTNGKLARLRRGLRRSGDATERDQTGKTRQKKNATKSVHHAAFLDTKPGKGLWNDGTGIQSPTFGQGLDAGGCSYPFALANRLFTSAQLTTFHHAAR